MTSVISPWVFYLMPICENISFFGCLFGVISIIVAIGLSVGLGFKEASCYPDEDTIKVLKPLKKKLFVIGIVGCLLALLVPRESTITKMLVAQNVTYERVEMATDTVQSVYEDIMSLFEEDDD